MKTKQKLIVTLALAFTAFAEAGDSGSYLRKSFLVCVNKDAEVELMAELTQDLDQPANAIYETAGTAVYNFKGKQYSGAK